MICIQCMDAADNRTDTHCGAIPGPNAQCTCQHLPHVDTED